MSSDRAVDYYEILQISPNAEPETVHRVYRLLAQRCHPDNTETGDEQRFRELTEAYRVISDPEARAKYDVVHVQKRQDRWRMVSKSADIQGDFRAEHALRLNVLEVLYTERRMNPAADGMSVLDLEQLLGRAREHLEFAIWYLIQRKYVTRSDTSALVITVDGVDFLENNRRGKARRLLRSAEAAS